MANTERKLRDLMEEEYRRRQREEPEIPKPVSTREILKQEFVDLLFEDRILPDACAWRLVDAIGRLIDERITASSEKEKQKENS